MTYQILHGNNLDILPTLADNSVDSIVTDPPYELGFMGKKWDSSGIAYSVELWEQCLRVLKPGGHLLAFSGSRTYHRMVVAIEDAGFEIRDMISWISNKTFPKSLNIGKAIDKAAGAEREVIGQRTDGMSETAMKPDKGWNANSMTNVIDITKPATDGAKQWDGWGTGLKPTVEPIVMARKPVEGTIANNVLTYGTGGINIDGSRIGTDQRINPSASNANRESWRMNTTETQGRIAEGRWPANLIIDQDTAELLDEQSGQLKGGTWNSTDGARHFGNEGKPTNYQTKKSDDSSGGASRFFYVAKASKRDRNEGLEELPDHDWRKDGAAIPQRNDRPFLPSKNHHPTVKPTSLMEYLIKLVTPPNGIVLDPFTGSGSTGKAAILQGFDFIGIEMTEEYLPIIEGRLKHAEAMVAEAKEQDKAKENEVLF
jgi:site-specific DNA-methyltransferase (adenine-specific)